MRLVRPGGTIIVQGGVYEENLVLTKAVAIRGVADPDGRNVVFRPAAGKACVTVSPDAAMAPVALSQVIFKFENATYGAPCIDVKGGSFTLKDSFVIPADADIPVRAAYGPMMPELYDHISNPPRDDGEAAFMQRLDRYSALHKRSGNAAGAENANWTFLSGGTSIEQALHTRTTQSGPMQGPSAGIRVAAGDVRLEGNVIIGAAVGVSFKSTDEALIRGSVENNVILGNGVGVGVEGIAANLLVSRNTIRYNAGPGVKADVYDGLRLIANEVSGNQRGVDFTAKVRMATVASNLIVGNLGDAMKVSSGFYGAVAANTIADNRGCTIQFYSAQDKILNNVDRKVTLGEGFTPGLSYERTNFAENNDGDRVKKRRIKDERKRSEMAGRLAACGDPLKS
jgi:nitrous oxidase accessory protein NosD